MAAKMDTKIHANPALAKAYGVDTSAFLQSDESLDESYMES